MAIMRIYKVIKDLHSAQKQPRVSGLSESDTGTMSSTKIWTL